MMCISLGIYTYQNEGAENSSSVFVCPVHTLDTVVGSLSFVTAFSSDPMSVNHSW